MGTLLWLAGGVLAVFTALDLWIAPAEKKRLWEYLKSKPTLLDDLPRAAETVFVRIFGETHFSFNGARTTRLHRPQQCRSSRAPLSIAHALPRPAISCAHDIVASTASVPEKFRDVP